MVRKMVRFNVLFQGRYQQKQEEEERTSVPWTDVRYLKICFATISHGAQTRRRLETDPCAFIYNASNFLFMASTSPASQHNHQRRQPPQHTKDVVYRRGGGELGHQIQTLCVKALSNCRRRGGSSATTS